MASEAEFLTEAKLLLKNNSPLEALQVLEENMDEYAGMPGYDFLLGQAALKSKKPNLAIFALERVSLSEPQFQGARFLLGKAYLEAGELEQASREFDLIIRSSNKESLRESSKLYLRTIDKIRKAAAHSLNVDITLGAGHDSNANNATESNKFLGTVLSPQSRANASSLTKATLAASYSRKLSKRYLIQTHAQLFKNNYTDATFVNTLGGALNFRVNRQSKKIYSQNIDLSYQYVMVDEKLNSRQLATAISHQQKVSKKFFIKGSLRGVQTNYHKDYDIKDFRGINGGLQLQHFSHTKNKDTIISAFSLITGTENPIVSDSYYGRKYAGALVNLYISHKSRKSSINSSIAYIYSKYDNPFFGSIRNDK